ILSLEDIPAHLRECLGQKHSQRINTMVTSVIRGSADKDHITMTPEVQQATNELRDFLFEHVYLNPVAKGEESKAVDMLIKLYEYFVAHPEKLPETYRRNIDNESVERCVADYVAGMTDRYAIQLYGDLFIPQVWRGR
ncbi:MAG: deoxyguanosinetriphosphate triphosphohydrolase, partial [Clostridia bacterium]|nr:deoxyguanosinetriphosphate triphosphohydrolase [Clostridia bacterium]